MLFHDIGWTCHFHNGFRLQSDELEQTSQETRNETEK